MNRALLVLAISWMSLSAFADPDPVVTRQHLQFPCALRMLVNVMEVRPTNGPILGDYYHLTGFSDESENNLAYAQAAAKMGLRTVIWDYPNHGKTKTNFWNWINWWSVDGLGRLTAEVIQKHEEDSARPIILGGWSTGGTIATRMVLKRMLGPLQARLKALLAFAPGIPVQFVPGRFGQVLPELLTSNPDRGAVGRISISNVYSTLPFGLNLYLTSRDIASARDILDVPTLLMTAGVTEDFFVDTNGVRHWGQEQRDGGAPVYQQNFDGARHALLVEPNGVGDQARDLALRFAVAATQGNMSLYQSFGQPRLLNEGP